MRGTAYLALIAIATVAAPAWSQTTQPQAGDEHLLTRSYRTTQESSDESSGSSRGSYAIRERVVRVGAEGIEFEYDLPPEASAEDRAREWQMPARILQSPDGSRRLLNRSELEARLETWLRTAGWTREVCGRWIFTWNAFRIGCDPDQVLDAIATFDLRAGDLREGALYRDDMAGAAGTLARRVDAAGQVTYGASLAVDPDAVRRGSAETDMALAELQGEALTIEAALRNHAADRISGTIEVRFELDQAGRAKRRTDVTRLVIETGERIETRTQTIVVERHPGAASPISPRQEWRTPG